MFRLEDIRLDDGRGARFAPRRDLPALIELYEANYVRLMNLAPDLETMSPIGSAPIGSAPIGTGQAVDRFAHDALDKFTLVSSVAGAMDLHLTVIERHRFTTTINLSYLFRHEQRNGAQHVEAQASARLGYAGITRADDLIDDDDNLVLEPNARLCIYHDVRAVELLSHYRRRRSRAVYPGQRGRMPEVERRWSTNRFVGKWLKFCLNQGHLFLAGVSNRSPRIDAMVREGRGRPQREAAQ